MTDELDDFNDETSPIIAFVEQTLKEALRSRTSHLHFIPDGDGLVIRARIDGTLVTRQTAPKHLRRGIIARLKILSNLDIAERRLPQHGRFTLKDEGGESEVRIATLPTSDGEERVLLRLFNAPPLVALADSGLDPSIVQALLHAVRGRRGMIVVGGLAESGRTSTLTNLALAARDGGADVISVEMEIERRLPGITQIQSNPRIGFAITHGVKAALHQDPDVIATAFVGKADSAEAAFEAVAAGKLVIADMYIPSAAGVIQRFLDCGVDPFEIADGLRLVVCQRLLRKLCPQCRERDVLDADVAARHGLAERAIWKPRGCAACHRGWLGRTAAGEMIAVGGDVKARPATTLRRAALHLVARGVTSLAEALAVTDAE